MLDEATALEKLTVGQVRLPPLELRLAAPEARVGGRRLDWIVELRWKDETVQFAVEYIRVATPKNFLAALDQLRTVGTASGHLFPMIMAPYLAPNELEQLFQEEISGIDLCGNGVVIVPGKWLVYRTGLANKYPSSAPIKKVYEGKSSLVGRLLVLGGGFSQVSELWREIERRGGKISLGTVSKVLKVMEQELIVSREDGVAVIQPDLLLDRLAANYEAPSDLERIRGRLPERPGLLKELASLAQEKGTKLAASGALGYAQIPTSDPYPPIYVEALDELAGPIGFERADRFANVEFRETRDPLVYFDRRLVEDISWTSPVQAYLDLAQGGIRDREFAADLRVRLLEGEFD